MFYLLTLKWDGNFFKVSDKNNFLPVPSLYYDYDKLALIYNQVWTHTHRKINKFN